MRHLIIALAWVSSVAVLGGCSSEVKEAKGSSASADTANAELPPLECQPIGFSLCDWLDVGNPPDNYDRRIVMDYQIWGEPDGAGNCIYSGLTKDDVYEAIRNRQVPELTGVTKSIRRLCGNTDESVRDVSSCQVIVEENASGPPTVYGHCKS